MLDFLKLLVPLFLAPKNYYQVRQKLGAFAVYEAWLAISILRNVPSVSAVLQNAEQKIFPSILTELAPWAMRINLSGLLIAFLVALFFYMFHLHDRISDLIGLRSRFDRNKIIFALATLVGVSLTPDQKVKVKESQDRIMRNVFYRYTSSTSEDVLVDRHDIEQALESWSWLWVFIEGLVIWIPSAVMAWYLGALTQVYIFCGIAILYVVLIVGIRPFLARRARAQIEAIADDPTARHSVIQTLNAI